MLHPMNANGSAREQLSSLECLRLIASVPFGRVVYTLRALPAVEPVNFAVHNGDIVFMTEADGKLAAAVRQAIVAFEADDLDVHRDGWTVTVVGAAQEVTDPVEVARLRQIGLASWLPGDGEQFVRIAPGIITGRWLRHAGHADGQAVGERAV
jgi:uncharacterized protein